MISKKKKGKESNELLYAVRSLVMVREQVASARRVNEEDSEISRVAITVFDIFPSTFSIDPDKRHARQLTADGIARTKL